MKKEKPKDFGKIIKESGKINPKIFGIVFVAVLIITILIWGLLMAQIPPYDIRWEESIKIDGGSNDADGAYGMVMDEYRHIYATGYVTTAGQAKNIWLAKFDYNLGMIKNRTINGLANNDDVGYALSLDETGFLYMVGYMFQSGEDNNIFLAKFNRTNLLMVKNVTINGPANGTDEGYGMLYNRNDNNLYITGTVQEPNEGYNIYLGKFDTDLNLIKNITLNGPTNNTDKGRFLTFDDAGNLYVSGSKSQAGTGYDLWLGKFDVNFTLLNEIMVASSTSGEDKGYGLLYDGEGTIYITGTIYHNTQNYNVFLAKYNTSLHQIKNITLNGNANGEDIGYSIALNGHYITQTGVYSEIDGGANIFVALYNENLQLLKKQSLDGDAHSYDSAYYILNNNLLDPYSEEIVISGLITEPSENTNIWIAKCFSGSLNI